MLTNVPPTLSMPPILFANSRQQLSYLFNNPTHWRDKNDVKRLKHLTFFRAEIEHQLTFVGESQFQYLDKLAIGKFDTAAYSATKRFWCTGTVNSNRLTKANQDRDALVKELTNGNGQDAALLKARYQNEAVNQLVENNLTGTKIIQWKGQLVRKVYPIYEVELKPTNPLDFRAEFYVPYKHLFGQRMDTFLFNVLAILVYDCSFFLVLYFDLLKRLVQGFEIAKKVSFEGKSIGFIW